MRVLAPFAKLWFTISEGGFVAQKALVCWAGLW